MEKMPQYYAAYGADLNMRLLMHWCEEHHFAQAEFYPYRKAYLPDYELIVNVHSQLHHGGILNIRPVFGQVTPVCLFEINEIGVKALKRKAQASHKYQYHESVALTADGQAIPVFTFLVPPEKQSVQTYTISEQYKEIIIEGAIDLGLETKWHEAALTEQRQHPLYPGLFVYGTLKTDGSNFPFLKSFQLKSAHVAKVEGLLVDLGEYPGFVCRTDESNTVWGEYLEFEKMSTAIRMADQIEEFYGFNSHNSLYRRALISVEIPRLTAKLAWIYIYLNDDPLLTIVEEGYWGLPPFAN